MIKKSKAVSQIKISDDEREFAEGKRTFYEGKGQKKSHPKVAFSKKNYFFLAAFFVAFLATFFVAFLATFLVAFFVAFFAAFLAIISSQEIVG
jgi:ABC-type phosphate/phosphonate transport system permease subunit